MTANYFVEALHICCTWCHFSRVFVHKYSDKPKVGLMYVTKNSCASKSALILNNTDRKCIYLFGANGSNVLSLFKQNSACLGH